MENSHVRFLGNLILNLWDCVAAGQVVGLGSGAGQLIESFDDTAPARVMAWDSRDDQSYQADVTAHLPRGVAECIRIVLADGRQLLCTPDHRVLVRDSNQRIYGSPLEPSKWRWVAAKDIDDTMRVGCSVDSPALIALSNSEKTFQLVSGGFTLRCNTPAELKRTLAYARLLGYVNGNGCLTEHRRLGRNVFYEGHLTVGHQLAICAIMDDIRALTGITPFTARGTSESSLFRISLPAPLSRSMALLPGQTLGDQMEAAATGTWPSFLATAPRVVVQEFLGGLFGANGFPPYVRWEPSIKAVNLVQNKYIGMSCGNTPAEVTGLKAKMTLLVRMMQRVGVTTEMRLREEKYPESTDKKREMISVNVIGKGVNGLEVARVIGYRYDVHKQMRSTAACAWWRLCKAIVHEIVTISSLAEELRARAGGIRVEAKYLDEAVLQYKMHSPILGGHLTTDFRQGSIRYRAKHAGATGKRMKSPKGIHKHVPVKQFLVDLDLFSCFSTDPTLYDDKLSSETAASISFTDDDDDDDDDDDVGKEHVDLNAVSSASSSGTSSNVNLSSVSVNSTDAIGSSSLTISSGSSSSSTSSVSAVANAAVHESHRLVQQLRIACHCLQCKAARPSAAAASSGETKKKVARGVERHWNGVPVFGMRVAKVDHNRRRLPVYDLTVPGYNSFAVNGIVVHNCGGQDTFMENYFESQKDAIFRNVEVLIYVFDIESPQHKRDMEQFLSCVEMVAKYSTSEQTKVYCLIHKMDLIHKEEDRLRIYTERDREIRTKVAPFFNTSSSQQSSQQPSQSTVTTFATSIWDETLYKAWSAIVHSLIPNVHTLERQLVAFCQLLAADEVVLFEKATFLVICSAVVKHNNDAHRYEKISNIIKQFKLSCSKSSNGEFLSMQVQNKHFIAFIDQFTTNTYIMVVGPGEGSSGSVGGSASGGSIGVVGGGKMLPAAVQLNLKVARPHFERFVQQNVTTQHNHNHTAHSAHSTPPLPLTQRTHSCCTCAVSS